MDTNRNGVSDERLDEVLQLISTRWRSSYEFYQRAKHAEIPHSSAEKAIKKLRELGRIESRGNTRNREFRRTPNGE